MSEFHFIRPLWLLALLPCAGLLLWYYLGKRHRGQWTGYVEPQLWPYVLAAFDQERRLRPLLLTALAAVLCVLALAGPTWQRMPQPVFRNQGALIIALDLSSSMNSQDIKPSRLQRARHKLLDILDRRREGQTALIVYAGAAFAVTPLTDDVNTIRAQVADLETRLMPAQGSRPDLAADKAIELFAQGGVQHGHLLLITDEIDADPFEPARDRLLNAGHSLSILGVGTPQGAPIPLGNGGFLKDHNGAIVLARLNENELRRLGPYRHLALDDSDIDYLLPDFNPQLLADDSRQTGLQTDTWRDAGPWLLLPLLAISVLAFRRGLLLWACLLFLPWAQPARAFSWEDLWLNDNQQAKHAFETEQYETAQQLFDDPEWRAASAYRKGDYERAAESLAEAKTADALYNRGNALAQLGRAQEAIDSYNRALEQNPEHEDARYNRDLLLQQQQSNPQQQQQQNGQSGQNQSPQQNGQDSQSQDQGEQSQAEDGDKQQQQSQEADSGQQQKQQAQAGKDKPRDKEQQQQNPAQPGQEPRQTEQGEAQAATEGEEDPQKQNREQWLRRVPDDPGGLLKKKFQYQYRKQQQDEQQPSEQEQPW